MLGLGLLICLANCGSTTSSIPTIEPAFVEHPINPVQFNELRPSDEQVRAIVVRLLEIKANSMVRRKFIHPVIDSSYGSESFRWTDSSPSIALPTPIAKMEIRFKWDLWQVERGLQFGEIGIFGKLPVQVSLADGTSNLYTIELFLANEQTVWHGMCPEITNDLKLWVP